MTEDGDCRPKQLCNCMWYRESGRRHKQYVCQRGGFRLWPRANSAGWGGLAHIHAYIPTCITGLHT